MAATWNPTVVKCQTPLLAAQCQQHPRPANHILGFSTPSPIPFFTKCRSKCMPSPSCIIFCGQLPFYASCFQTHPCTGSLNCVNTSTSQTAPSHRQLTGTLGAKTASGSTAARPLRPLAAQSLKLSQHSVSGSAACNAAVATLFSNQ